MMDNLRLTRERFLAGDALAAEAETRLVEPGRRHAGHDGRSRLPRAEIVTSWRRSRLVGVQPESNDLPYVPNAPTPRRLLTAAAPVIDAVAAELADTTGTVLLADSDVRILDRRVGTRSWMNNLDRHNVAPGFVFAEEFAGTNGLGCAMEEGRLFQVGGAEHFRETLQSFVCIAAPIRHPVRRTVEGALNLTCSVDEFSPFARTVLRRAVADIEQRLLDLASHTERMLLDQFVARSKRTNRPVVAVGADVFICNPAAAKLLERSDRELLWYWAAPALRHRAEATEALDLAEGRAVRARATRVGEGSRVYGAVIEIDTVTITSESEPHEPAVHALGESPGGTLARSPAARVGRRTDSAERPAPHTFAAAAARAITGRSASAGALRSAIARVLEDHRPVLVTGELGSGRRRVARTILTALAPHRHLTDVDAGGADWSEIAGAAVRAGDPLLLRNAHALAVADGPSLRALLDQAEQTGAPVAATTDVLTPQLIGVFPAALAVPPLRERRQDLRDLAAALLPKINPGRSIELHPAALLALEHHDWPGNVRELQLMLSLASQTCVGQQILERHLPEALRITDPGLSPIERAERETILAALNEAGGNKLAAASALGLARSTLYRKMRALKIDNAAGF